LEMAILVFHLRYRGSREVIVIDAGNTA